MDVRPPASPSPPSRASTTICDSDGSAQSARLPVPPGVLDVYVTPSRITPSRSNEQQHVSISHMMQHVITIEHDSNLRSRASIHESLLCDYSQKLRKFSARAEAQRALYSDCDDTLDRLGSIAMTDMTPEQYEEQKLGTKLVPIIMKLDKSCPLREYEKSMRTVIKQAVEVQFTNKNLVQSADKPKTLKAFQDLILIERLGLLNPEGAIEVAEEICSQLQVYRAKEVQTAKNNVNKAWAQGRLLVRGANERSVASLVQWAYQKTLVYEDGEHLYDLWALATRLEFVVLADECMDCLFQTASNRICTALASGHSLRHLLGLSKEHDAPDSDIQSDAVVTTIFSHVLKDDNPPEKLSQLVIHAMARAMDTETWAELQHTVNQSIARQLIAVMVTRRELKPEQGANDGVVVKPENSAAGDNVQPTMTEAPCSSTFAG